ncbi:MAG: hypothetical protein M1820_007863 [Bogoriella megaspora]|nr:MAG: hypothetical protein M1820_007863 [Bogoriella megaspora]
MDAKQGDASSAIRVGVFVALILIYPVTLFFYNLYLHPLSRFPGRKTWMASRLPFIRSTLRGDCVHEIRKMHDTYGGIVRIAPDEVSFAVGPAWNDIFAHRPGHREFPRNPVWWNKAPGQPHSIITVGQTDHARMRRVLSYAFSAKALREQEPVLQGCVDQLITRLREKAGGTEVDIVKWYNYCTFDIIGDVAVGEPFGCLTTGSYHWWVATIFNHFKASSFLACVRFYPVLEWLLLKSLPAKMMETQRAHYEEGASKLRRRLKRQPTRPDMIAEVLKNNSENGMAMDEIEATFNLMFFAGSETTATTLSGITNYLVQCPDIQAKLKKEVRGTFTTEEEITFTALAKLPYLNAVIEEGLRMCPPLPGGLPRVVPHGGDTVVGEWLPAGTHVEVHTWSVNRSAQAFHQPNTFAPERWLPEFAQSTFKDDQKAASQPFSMGPRMCIGKNFAYAEMRLILARVIWAFDLEPGRSGLLDWNSLRAWGATEKQSIMLRLQHRAT